MAYFAQVNENNIVETVLKLHNNHALSGHDFFTKELGLSGTWLQTSYNTRKNKHYIQVPIISAGVTIGTTLSADGLSGLRGNYASVGFIYDPTNDVFYPRQPYPSWILDTATWWWTAPIPYPMNGNMYKWDEPTKNWVLVPGLSGAPA
jgi:hypothetical protein